MTKRRWLKSAIETSAQAQPALPFQRGSRRKPAAFKQIVAAPAPQAAAAAR